jgi:hypothetical protein
MTIRGSIALTCILLAVGCSDDGAECGPTASCVPPVEQVQDLEVTAVTVGTPGRTHPQTGLRVVDSVVISYTIANRGNAPSLPEQVVGSATIGGRYQYAIDSIGALAPGQTVSGTISVSSGTKVFNAWPEADRFLAVVSIQTSVDDATENNIARSDTAHLALPILEVVSQEIAEPRFRVNDPIRMSVTVTNHSKLVAARDFEIRHCLWDFDVGCWPRYWTSFGNIAIPDLLPGETRTLEYITAVTPTAFEEGYIYYSVTACATPKSSVGPYAMYDNGVACGSAGYVELWPDYEACSPPLLTATPVTLTEPNCGHYPIPSEPEPRPGYWNEQYGWKKYYVFAFDAVAGRTYRVSGLAGGYVKLPTGWWARDLDPLASRVKFETTGRYYITFYGTAAHTVSVEAVP